MVGKLTYDQVLEIAKDLRAQVEIIERLLENRDLPELKDFTATVEGYSKFLENTVEINKDADIALAELKRMKKYLLLLLFLCPSFYLQKLIQWSTIDSIHIQAEYFHNRRCFIDYGCFLDDCTTLGTLS